MFLKNRALGIYLLSIFEKFQRNVMLNIMEVNKVCLLEVYNSHIQNVRWDINAMQSDTKKIRKKEGK